ncbi:MAG: fimbrillin family protein, partial [Prevotella sp.]|nr:fimbrillin family protein [Prevotella sp.]
MMAAPLLATACMQEMPNEEPEQVGNAPKVVAELSEEPQTRTTIDAAEADNGGTLAVLWMPEDQIGVFSTESGNVLYVNDEQTENIPNASFSSTADITGEIQYAYYPYAETNNDNTAESLTGTLPAEQVMGDRITGDYKYGELKARTAEGGYKFRFHNMFSLVRFNIDATGTTLAGQTLESVTLTVTRNGAAVPVTGEFTFDATDGSYELGTTSNELKTVWNK